jgi:hypothetical protein
LTSTRFSFLLGRSHVFCIYICPQQIICIASCRCRAWRRRCTPTRWARPPSHSTSRPYPWPQWRRKPGPRSVQLFHVCIAGFRHLDMALQGGHLDRFYSWMMLSCKFSISIYSRIRSLYGFGGNQGQSQFSSFVSVNQDPGI